ncbi:hypothetical protein [Thermomonospora cellulosilytica]|uniref:Uncharacterized protein n=1 Tax=Thermomonospora cellulosilytica TaxID=1411118 RepID=A0A7W3MTR5_9ACTN|nr:hypothetical protein [Thermomonospora cellulosilytica]MBA9001752.1 hypothetical protein [Thermomonospora cellulosilytica]
MARTARRPESAPHRPKHARIVPRRPRPVGGSLATLGGVTVMAVAFLLAVVSVAADDDEGAPVTAPPLPSSTPSPPPSAWASPTPTPSESESDPGPAETADPPAGPRPAEEPPEPDREHRARVTLTLPEDGQRLADDRDFMVEGTVRDLGDDDLRIFIYAEDRRTFYLADYRPEDIAGNGRWTIRSTGIGQDWGGDGDTYLVKAVLAAPSCQRVLDDYDLGQDQYPAFRSLPDGCRIAARTRVVED